MRLVNLQAPPVDSNTRLKELLWDDLFIQPVNPVLSEALRTNVKLIPSGEAKLIKGPVATVSVMLMRRGSFPTSAKRDAGRGGGSGG